MHPTRTPRQETSSRGCSGSVTCQTVLGPRALGRRPRCLLSAVLLSPVYCTLISFFTREVSSRCVCNTNPTQHTSHDTPKHTQRRGLAVPRTCRMLVEGMAGSRGTTGHTTVRHSGRRRNGSEHVATRFPGSRGYRGAPSEATKRERDGEVVKRRRGARPGEG